MRYSENKNDGRKIEYRVFDSMDEIVNYVSIVNQSRVEDHDCTQRESFTGRRFSDWAEVYKATREAWPEGIEVLEKMLTDFGGTELPKPVSRKRKMRFAEDDGDELDYDRLRSGQAFWRYTRRANTKGPATITIMVDVAANCHVNHQDILWRGAAAVALTKILEEAGYRVELWLIDKTVGVWSKNDRKYDIDAMHAVCLKRPSDVLDTSTLISAVSGWCFRTVFFRACCAGSHYIDSGLGHAQLPNNNDLDEVSRDAKRILIAGVWNYEDAVELIKNTINSITTNNKKE
ncbi:MAG: hypothetical protein ABSA16_02155 [Thermoguttaceae bacterium]|jgi:hypothetical protein